MTTLRVTNWRKWQSYRGDRGQPPWIKVHRCVMRNPEWVALSDGQRGQLVAIWLLAADHDGVIPASAQIIRKLCYMDSDPDLQLFVSFGFIEYDDNVTPTRGHPDANTTHQSRVETEAETETETKAEGEGEYAISHTANGAGVRTPSPRPDGSLFSELWAESGSGSLIPAEQAYHRAVPALVSHEDLAVARRRYVARNADDQRFVKGLGRWISEHGWCDPTLSQARTETLVEKYERLEREEAAQ